MSEEALRFERAGTRWFRYGLPALVGVFVAVVVVRVLFDHHWWFLGSAGSVLMSWTGFWLNARTRTLINRDRIVVQRGLRRQDIPTSQIVAVTQSTAWSPVVARLVSGETIALPRVEAHDLETVSRLIHQGEPG